MPDMIEGLTAEEQALLDADRADQTPVEPTGPPPERTSPPQARTSEQTETKPIAETSPEKEEVPATEGEHPPQTVPYSALAEERNRRKEAEKQRQADREQMNRLAGQLDVYSKRFGPVEEQKPAAPTAAEQPIEVLQELVQWKQQLQQQEQETAQWTQFGNAVIGAAEEYKRSTPDLDAAVQHLVQTNAVRWVAEGYGEADIPQLTQRYLAEMANRAFQRGINPGSVFYAAAKAIGYQKAEAENPANPAQQTPPRGSNGQFQAAAEKLAAVARGQQAAGRSLSGAGGGSNPGELTAEAIGSMSDEDFAALSDRVWKKVMDG